VKTENDGGIRGPGPPLLRTAAGAMGSFFFIGYIPAGSGTAASMAGALIWVLISRIPAYYWTVFLTIGAGFLVSGYAERKVFGEKDSSKIVIDEVSGIFIAYLSFTFTPPRGYLYLAAGFVLFRFFDILKPFPIFLLERVKGGPGIMLDDIVSGLFSNLVLQGIRLLTGW